MKTGCTTAKRCRHCRDPRKLITRPRGLCWHCYYTPGVRDQYPSASKFGVRGVANLGHRNAPLPEPTTAMPGSPEKIAVMEERALRGEQVFHPDDASNLTTINRRAGRRAA